MMCGFIMKLLLYMVDIIYRLTLTENVLYHFIGDIFLDY